MAQSQTNTGVSQCQSCQYHRTKISIWTPPKKVTSFISLCLETTHLNHWPSHEHWNWCFTHLKWLPHCNPSLTLLLFLLIHVVVLHRNRIGIHLWKEWSTVQESRMRGGWERKELSELDEEAIGEQWDLHRMWLLWNAVRSHLP